MNINHVLMEDCDYISKASWISWNRLRNKYIFVTGATGLIGFNLVHALLYADMKYQLNLHVIAYVRNEKKAQDKFASIIDNSRLQFVVGDLESVPSISSPIDYIIHGAAITDSKSFVSNPVELLKMAANGTITLLELAKQKQVKGFVFLSSMEVYGTPNKGKKVSEDDVAGFIPEKARNSYPISKQFGEMLCCAYADEYNIPARVIRLTQTFGPGVEYNDKRVFAEFMRCAMDNKDIILKTKGETERCYLYTADAVTAILTVMLSSKTDRCYTAANPETYCSIIQMAKLVANEIADNRINVSYQLDETNQSGYANTLFMDLDVSKIEGLGWKPGYTLQDMFWRMIAWIKQ